MSGAGNRRVARRDLLRAAGGLLALGGLTACGKKAFTCTDTVGMAAGDALARQALAYVEPSMDPTKECSACQQYVRASDDGCGTCKLVKGPIHPKGSCKAFTKAS
jgi:hypothetical protein